MRTALLTLRRSGSGGSRACFRNDDIVSAETHMQIEVEY